MAGKNEPIRLNGFQIHVHYCNQVLHEQQLTNVEANGVMRPLPRDCFENNVIAGIVDAPKPPPSLKI